MAGSNTCGIGGWGGPLPGDPDNNSALHARAVFGGIDVYWSMPATNPFAVAYTKVWRSVLPDFNSAIVIASVGGDFFYDKNESTLDTVYYYWIQFVSVNGTVGEPIGPDQAQSRPPVKQVIELLSGDIEETMLSTALRAQLGQITTNYGEFVNEVEARNSAITNITDSLAFMQTTLNDAIVLIGNEITSRQDGDSALVQSVNSIALANADALALIQSEQQARIDGDEAIASDLTVLATQTNDPLTGLAATRATLQNDYYTKTSADAAVALAVSGLETTFTNTLLDYVTSANLTTNYYTIAESDTAIANATQNLISTTALDGALGNYTTTAVLQQDYYTKTAADSAISSAVTAAQTTFDGNLAAVELSLNSAIGVVNGELDSIGALYTAKVVTQLSDGTKMIGGFGIYNDGTTVDAGFDVNFFWVGKPAGGKKYPFIISGGEVFIDQAVINELTFTKLRDETGSVMVMTDPLDGLVKLKADYLKVNTASIEYAAVKTLNIGDQAVSITKYNVFTYSPPQQPSVLTPMSTYTVTIPEDSNYIIFLSVGRAWYINGFIPGQSTLIQEMDLVIDGQSLFFSNFAYNDMAVGQSLGTRVFYFTAGAHEITFRYRMAISGPGSIAGSGLTESRIYLFGAYR